MHAARLIRLYALRIRQPGETADAAMARAHVELPTIARLADAEAESAMRRARAA